MITDDDARALVASLREIAEVNRQEVRHLHANNCWRKCMESRSQAYDLAAGWLWELIPKEITEEAKQ